MNAWQFTTTSLSLFRTAANEVLFSGDQSSTEPWRLSIKTLQIRRADIGNLTRFHPMKGWRTAAPYPRKLLPVGLSVYELYDIVCLSSYQGELHECSV